MPTGLYDPKLGRFLEVDPVEGGSCNDYDSVCGDPVNGFDLGGMAQCVNASCSKAVVSATELRGRARRNVESQAGTPDDVRASLVGWTKVRVGELADGGTFTVERDELVVPVPGTGYAKVRIRRNRWRVTVRPSGGPERRFGVFSGGRS